MAGVAAAGGALTTAASLEEDVARCFDDAKCSNWELWLPPAACGLRRRHVVARDRRNVRPVDSGDHEYREGPPVELTSPPDAFSVELARATQWL
jgi:hypothetical protein